MANKMLAMCYLINSKNIISHTCGSNDLAQAWGSLVSFIIFKTFFLYVKANPLFAIVFSIPFSTLLLLLGNRKCAADILPSRNNVPIKATKLNQTF